MREERPQALLLAPTGLGKTALLIQWLPEVQARREWDVVFVPISQRYQTATAGVALGLLVSGLARAYQEATPRLKGSPEELRALAADYLRRDPGPGRKILVVLDGLDEAVGWSVGRDLFPRRPSAQVRLLGSAREMADKEKEAWLEELGWEPAWTAELALKPLGKAEVADVLRRLGGPAARLVEQPEALDRITAVSEGDPLTIRLLALAIQDGRLTLAQLTRQPPGLEAYVREWLRELREKAANAEAVYALLGLCAVALGPLAAEDVQRLDGKRLGRRLDVTEAAKAVGRFVIGHGSEDSGYVFSHSRLRELFLEKVLSPGEVRQFRQRLLDYGQEWYQSRDEPPSQYLRHFWVSHLMDAGQQEAAVRLITQVAAGKQGYEQIWAAARYEAEGSYSGYMGDLLQVSLRAERDGDLDVGFRSALLGSSVRSLSANLAPEVLAGLVRVGRHAGGMSMAAALEHVRHMPDARRQVKALRALVASAGPVPADLAMQVALTMESGAGRAEALELLAPLLSEASLLTEGLEAARGIRGGGDRARALAALAPLGPDPERTAILAEALQAVRSAKGDAAKAAALGKLAAVLPQSLLPQALDIIQGMKAESAQAEALGALPPHLSQFLQLRALMIAGCIGNNEAKGRALGGLARCLSDERLYEAFEQVLAIEDEFAKSRALAVLAPRLPDGLRSEELLAKALGVARGMSDGWARAQALESLALQAAERATILGEALQAVESIDAEVARAETLGLLASRLPEGGLLPRAMVIAAGIRDEGARAWALGALALHAPREQQPGVYAEALKAVRCARSELDRVRALESLAPHLPAELKAELLGVARGIVDEGTRARALAVLAPHLAGDLLPQALEAARGIGTGVARAEALASLAFRLPEPEQASALVEARKAAQGVGDEIERAVALGTLVRQPAENGPGGLLKEAFEMALRVILGMADEGVRAQALETLASYWPEEVLPGVLAVAGAIRDSETRARAISILLPRVGLDRRAALLSETLEAVRGIQDQTRQAGRLGSVAAVLPAEFLPEALRLARDLADGGAKVRAIAALAPYLPEEDRGAAVAEALGAVGAIADESGQAEALGTLARCLPESLLAPALQRARDIREPLPRAEALGALAPRLAEDNRASILKEALDAVGTVAEPRAKIRGMAALAPQLGARERTSVLKESRLSATCVGLS